MVWCLERPETKLQLARGEKRRAAPVVLKMKAVQRLPKGIKKGRVVVL